jgi:hypothetical protein
MKIFSKKNLFVIFSVFSCITVFAQDPPPPTPPPPPPGLSIDQDVVVLLLFALLYGIYTVCRFHVKGKDSI